MDGTAILRTPLTEDQRAIVEMLKETLAQALEGNFHTIGIVVCMKPGFSHAMAGSDAGNLNLGCDDLKADILAAVKSSPKTKQVSKLLRGRMG